MQPAEIIADVRTYFEKKRKVLPVQSNRASMLGAPCLRQLVYFRTDWDKQALPDTGLMMVFEEGHEQEEIVKKTLQAAGYLVLEAQRALSDVLLKRYNISGHLDFFLAKGDDAKPQLSEVKSMSPFIFQAVNSLEDFQRYPWTRKYVAQMQIYLFGSGEEIGLFILKNKSTGELKVIECRLDLEYVEQLLKKAEAINAHVAAGTQPERIDDMEECDRCPFQHLCLPDKVNAAAKIIADPEFEMKLKRREELAPLSKEFKALDEEIKEEVKAVPEDQIIAGDFLITKKEQSRKEYTVKASTFYRVDIKQLSRN